jgi:hypothetical protein
MKKIFLACITFSLLFLAVSCDKDLPYPVDQVERGVLVDVYRVAGTDGVLSDGLTTGNYKIKLTIPAEQGDYSFMKCAQLLAVIQWADGKWSSCVVVDNITQFPLEVTINVADVYSKFSQSAPGLGQTLYFTTNIVRNDGYTIPGWTELMGFNNVAFAGWMVDGRPYSSNVRYSVACPLDLDDFTGECFVYLDEWWEEEYPITITRISETELSIEGLFAGDATNPLVIKVDLTDHSVSFGKQVLFPESGPAWWGRPPGAGYDNFALSAGVGTVNACDLSISFRATATVDAGSFGAVSFKLGK